MNHYGLYQPGEPRPRPGWSEQGQRASEAAGQAAEPLQGEDGNWGGWEVYHRQMFDLSKAPNAWIRWKMNSTGVNIARGLVAARNCGWASYVAEYGRPQGQWPLPHPPAVLWMPEYAYAACLGCLWINDGKRGEPASAGALAREHAREHVPVVAAEVERLLALPIVILPRNERRPPPVRAV